MCIKHFDCPLFLSFLHRHHRVHSHFNLPGEWEIYYFSVWSKWSPWNERYLVKWEIINYNWSASSRDSWRKENPKNARATTEIKIISVEINQNASERERNWGIIKWMTENEIETIFLNTFLEMISCWIFK